MALLNENQISQHLSSLDGWKNEGKQITKTYKTSNYIETIGFVNKIALLAERADHHPDLGVHYNKVVVTLSTHSEGGITEKDIKLASEIEEAR